MSADFTPSTFLQELAAAVMSRPDAAEVLVVLPSTRAASRFHKACAKYLGKAGWLPKTTTPNAWLQESTGLRPVDALEGLAYLYQAYKEIVENEEDKPEPPSFVNFAPWGRVVLRDFNELDHYLADVDDVLQNLHSIAGMEAWAPGATLHEGSLQFLRQSARLMPLYHRFRALLEPLGRGTTGYIARQAATRAELGAVGPVVVAGLAALTPAEQGFLLRIQAQGKLTLYADADPAYLSDVPVAFEAGGFRRDWDPALVVAPLKPLMAERPPKLHFVSCSSGVFECQWAAHALRQTAPSAREETVLVLPDGGQLSMLLQSLDLAGDGVNVTMGLAWSESPAAGFFEGALRMVETGRSWREADVAAWLGHPISVALHPGAEWAQAVAEWRAHVAAGHWTWITPARLAQHAPAPIAAWLDALMPLTAPDAAGFLAGLSAWSEDIDRRLEAREAGAPAANGDTAEAAATDVNPWIRASWKRLQAAIATCRQFQERFALFQSAKDVRDLLNQQLNSERVDLQGEPEKGLQVMGLLETRALDFKRVIVLDCNEGVLPQTSLDDSNIPFDLRRSLQPRMPTRHQREAIYAYYLYRLLQRAEEVYLVYRSNDEEREASRYLLQLQHSFRPGGKLLPQVHMTVDLPMQTDRPAIQPIHWTEQASEHLKRWTQKGVSPSAVNTWIDCPRKFYYQYILGIREPAQAEESMSSSIFGSVVHHVLDHGFTQQQGHVLRAEDFQRLLRDLNPLLDAAIADKYNQELMAMGVNHLQLAIAKATLEKCLKVELQEVQDGEVVTLLGVEVPLEWTGEWPEPVGQIRFAGTADRMERWNNNLRIIDYKTGKVEPSNLKIKSAEWMEQFASNKFPKALQLLMYGAIARKWLEEGIPSPAEGVEDKSRWIRPLPQDTPIVAAIRSTRNLKDGAMSLEEDGEALHIDSEKAQAFFDWLAAEIRRIHSDKPDISHRTEAAYCPYCVVLDPVERPF